MFNLYHAYKTDGKKTYLVDYNGYHRFYNEKGERNGYSNALKYCEEYNIPKEEIKQFDSMLEADRYEYLNELQKQGKIQDLDFHKKVVLLEEFINYNGDTIPEQTYNADFVYKVGNQRIVEDVKGRSLFEDTRFELAKALFDYRFKGKCYVKVMIRENGNWQEWHIGDKKKSSKLIKKQSAKNKELKKQLHDKEIEENKINRYVLTYNKLKAKDKLTSVEKKRFKQVEEFLKEKGRILWQQFIFF